jgi:hypothetical protein
METKFAQLLSEGIYRIRLREAKTIEIVQDELGYALGRNGGTAVHYWRKGHIPARQSDIAILAQEIVRRTDLGSAWLEEFLTCADFSEVEQLCQELFPESVEPPQSQKPDRRIKAGQLAPFVVGPPITHPSQFYGRTQALTRIFNLLKRFPLQNVAIVGPYRSGKTSLLHYLQTILTTPPNELRPGQVRDWLPNASTYRWVYVDFQDVRMCTRHELFIYLLNQLQIPVPSPVTLSAFMHSISTHLHQPTVILLDEIAAALAAPELDQPFWWSLRSLSSNQTGGLLSFILTAPNIPTELAAAYGKPSPFFNIFGHLHRLRPFTEAEARELIAASPLPFSEVDCQWILTQSGRWPCLMQALCHARFAALEAGDESSHWREDATLQLAHYSHLKT